MIKIPRENDILVKVKVGLGFAEAYSENEYWMGEDLDCTDEEIKEYRETGEASKLMTAAEEWFRESELESGYNINWDSGQVEYYVSNGFWGCEVNDEVDLDDYDLSENDLNSIKVSGTHEYFEDYLEELISNNIEFDYETLEILWINRKILK